MLAAVLALAWAMALSPAGAQTAGDSAPATPPAASLPAPGAAAPTALDENQFRLRGLEENLRQSKEDRQKLQADIDSMRDDRAKLSAALVDTTSRAQAAEAKVAEVERRLETAQDSEDAIRKSLDARRDVIANVLAALQRMSRKPPPAVLVSPEDVLRAVRTSMLLGAVVPELRAETEALASDLAELVRLRQTIADERKRLGDSLAALGEDRQRLEALVEERRKSLGVAEAALQASADKLRDLSKQAADLKDLIGRTETDAARAAMPANLHDPARLGPIRAFADTRGQLHLPVTGSLLKSFGAADGYGGTEKGVSLATRAGAVVAAPADGRVVFSGPYRSYGQLLILSTGGGYHVVLAGMERINVEVGQFVLAGEPVGIMGDGSARTAAAIAIGAARPVLYVEFRKDGAAIDPGPWWVRSEMEKARG